MMYGIKLTGQSIWGSFTTCWCAWNQKLLDNGQSETIPLCRITRNQRMCLGARSRRLLRRTFKVPQRVSDGPAVRYVLIYVFTQSEASNDPTARSFSSSLRSFD